MKTNEGLSSKQQHLGFAKDIAYVAIANVIAAALQFAWLPILTRWLDDTGLYGTWSIIWVTVTLLSYIAALGLGISTVRLLSAEKDRSRIRENFYSVFFTALATATLFVLLLTLFSTPFSSFLLKDSSNSLLVKLASIMIATQCLSQISFAFFRTFRQMKLYAAFIAGKALTEISLMALFWALEWDIKGVITAFIVSGAVSIVVALSIILKQIGFAIPRFTQIKSYLKYSLPLIPGTLVIWIIHSSDRYMIGSFMTPNDVGIYSAAYSLSNMITLFAVSLGLVLLPTISKAYDNGDLDKTKRLLNQSLKYIMMLAIPAAFGLSIMAAPLLQIFTQDDYISGSTIVPYVVSGLVVFSFYQVCIYPIYLVKKNLWVLILLSTSAILNVMLNLLLIPHLGILGAAIATLISYGILGILTTIVSSRYLKFGINYLSIAKSIAASAVMALVIWFLNPSSLIDVILSILAGIAIYSTAMLLLKGFSKKELGMIKSLILSINTKRQ